MNSLIKEIESSIKRSIDNYIECISDKYENIDVDDLHEIWNTVSKETKINECSTSNTQLPSKKKTSPKTSDQNVCPYKFIKGTKQDQTCGSKVKEGNSYCSRHKKYEGSDVKERKSSPDPVGSVRNTVKPPKSKSRSPVKSTQRVIRKNKKIDKLWHPETGLVFKSAKERTVIGKCIDDKITHLTDDDIDECRKWGFSFVPIDDDDDHSEDGGNNEDASKKKERFVYMEAASSSSSGKKFWECKVVDVKYITRHGKVGKDGNVKEKTFDSFEIASTEMDKSIKVKMKKGYVTKTSPDSTRVNEVNETDGDDRSTPSDIEELLNELQGDSSEENEPHEEDIKKTIGKKFISEAIGLHGKLTTVPPKDEDMLFEDCEEEDDE